MKTSNIRHNLFSKTDHDKVFSEKNYKAAVERTQVVKEELPPIRLDVRRRIAKEQLKLKLSRKTTVITQASSMSSDHQSGSSSSRSIMGLVDTNDDGVLSVAHSVTDRSMNTLAINDDYDDEHASIVSNESEELEKLKSSPDINKEEDLLNELGYIGHISEEEGNGDSDDSDSDDGSSTIGFSVQGGGSPLTRIKNNYSSPLEAHREFIEHANRKDTLRQIKSVGSVRALVAREQSLRAQSSDIIIPSSNRSSSIPDSSALLDSSKTHASANARDRMSPDSLKNTFMFISKLTEGLPHLNHLMSSLDSAMKGETPQEESHHGSSPGSPDGDKEEYNASPIGIKYKSMRSTFAFNSDTISSAKADTQLVSPVLSATTVVSLMNSVSTKGSILNSHKSSPSTIVRIAPTTDHLDSITDLGNHKESKFYVPALQSIHNQDKPVLQKLDKIFHRMTFQEADPKPNLVSTPKPPLSLETLFPDQIMRPDASACTDKTEDEEMEVYLEQSLASSPSVNKDNLNRVGAAALIDRLDRVLEQHGGQLIRNNSMIAPSIQSINGLKASTQTKVKVKDLHLHVDDDVDGDRNFYKIDVHRLHLPDINAPMVCLYTPSPQAKTTTDSTFFGDALKKEPPAIDASSSSVFDSPLLYSKHSNSFYKTTSSSSSPVDPSGGGIADVGDKNKTHSSSKLTMSLPYEGILDHSYKQGLSENTLTYVASMQVAQASNDDAAFHSLPMVSDVDMLYMDDDIISSSSSSPPYPLHTTIPRTHQMKPRSVTHETSDSGIYDIDIDEHRKLIPNTVVDLSEDGYIYQHSTNTYVKNNIENRSKFGQYQRSEYTPTSSEGMIPWKEHMDVKGELPVQIFSERHLEEIEKNTAGFGSPVIYIPKEPPALEPPPLNNKQGSSPVKGSIASISALGSPSSSLLSITSQHGIAQIPAGNALGCSSYAPVRTVMQYPVESPLNYVHYQPTGRKTNDNGSVGTGFDTARSSAYSLVDHSSAHSPSRRKEVPSSKAVGSLKNDINDFMHRLDTSLSPSIASFQSISSSSILTGGEVSENDLAKAKLWSRLNSRYSGDRDGEHTAKMKVKQYIFEGIKETTHIENQYTKDMDAWF